jgi:di/tricarboxylate transporter
LRQNFNRHFYTITVVGHIPPPVETWDYGGIILFFAMLFCLVFVPKDIASEVQIVMTTMMLMVGGNWVNAQDALTSVDFPLLGLIGAALSLARSVTSSGLADSIAGFVKDTEFSPLGAMYIVSGLSMLLTNVVTNNAAAALSVPIALSIADALDVSYKPFVMSVLYAASISFMTPIGYQTNTMIWGPGGYTFTDFMKIGIPLNLVYLVLACSLLPYIFPFDEKN